MEGKPHEQKPTKVPSFQNEAEERAFWESMDSADLIDWSKAERVRFPNLKLSTQTCIDSGADQPAEETQDQG